MSAAGNDGALSEVDTCSSDERVDVHVLVVPVVAWRSDLRFAYSSVCLESASAGFVRVGIHTTLVSLREEIASQLSPSLLPGQYVYLRNLGRCFTWVSCKQEEIMTVSMFIPPMTSSPEVYVLDGACFRGFPEGIVEPGRGVSNNSRHSFPIEHNRSMPVAHLPSQPLNQMISSSPHHPDQNLVVVRSHDPISHNTNFTAGNRKVAQQRLPILLPQQKMAPRQCAYTSDGSDLVQHRRDHNDQQEHHSYARNTNTVHTSDYTSPSKAGSNDDSINSNSLSDHSYGYGIDELHQESEVLTTSYGPSWQSSATQSLIVADSAANSLCSTTLPSSLNGAHHSHSPTKSVINSPHEVNSSGSKMLGPRVNVDLNLTDSVITENTEALERALFGSRGDGEGSSLTNSLLNVTGGATNSHYLQQSDQSLQNNNHAQLPQPHPQLVLHHGSYGDQNDHSSGHHGNITYTHSPSNHTANGITSLGPMVTPHGHNGTVDHASAISDNVCTLNNDQLTSQAYNVTTSHSTAVEKLHNVNVPPQRSNNTSCDETNLSSTNNVDQRNQRTNTRELDINTTTDNGPIDNNTIANMDPSSIPLTSDSGQLSPNVRASVQGSMISNDSLDNTLPSEDQSTVYNSSDRLIKQQNSVSSDTMAVRSSVEGDGCSQSRADITTIVNNTVNNSVVASHDSVEHHVTIADGEHQLEHSSTTAQSVSNDGELVEQSYTNGLSSQHLSLPMPGSHQPSLKTSTASEDGTSDCVKIVNQQSPLSQREAGVGTSMLFSTSPLPPITISPDKDNSTSEANGKPVELDEVNQLLAQLRMARDDRRTLENVKRELSDNVKKLQRTKKTTQDREDKKWKKMYFHEKRATQVNEERLRRLRNEVHRRMSTMATNSHQDTPLRGVHPILSPIATSEGPSEALNVKIQCARVEHDLAKLRQRLLAAQEKLKVEKEARVMAEAENRAIRKNVLQQKINCTLTRTI